LVNLTDSTASLAIGSLSFVGRRDREEPPDFGRPSLSPGLL
jgi:hypothetical protein